MIRSNVRTENLAHLLAVKKIQQEWDDFEHWGRVDRWLVGLWVLLLLGSVIGLICFL